MLQRAVIAAALAINPSVLICDEATTSLDVTIQAQILGLIKDLQKDMGFAVIFITHDFGVAAQIADRILVMYAGKLIEYGQTEEIFYDPRHPYTRALLESMPQLQEREEKFCFLEGTQPTLYEEPKGDAFAPRNRYCVRLDTLKEPPMFRISDTHYAATWLAHPEAPDIPVSHSIEKMRTMNAWYTDKTDIPDDSVIGNETDIPDDSVIGNETGVPSDSAIGNDTDRKTEGISGKTGRTKITCETADTKSASCDNNRILLRAENLTVEYRKGSYRGAGACNRR